MNKIFTFTLRLLLVVLIGTFTAPGFAWQMIASHSETPSMSELAYADHHEGNSYQHQHHHHDGIDDTAHNHIGHFLSHMPALRNEIGSLPIPATDGIAHSPYQHTFSHAAIEPPFKPPRNFLFF
jgi:uncharacterized protein involved in copper resistance